MEPPFFLLNGRTSRLPTDTALMAWIPCVEMDIVTNKEEVV